MSSIKDVLPNINQRHCDTPIEAIGVSVQCMIKTSLEEHRIDGGAVNEVRMPPMPPEQDPQGRYYDVVMVLHSTEWVLTIYYNDFGWRNDIIHTPSFTIGRGPYHTAA